MCRDIKYKDFFDGIRLIVDKLDSATPEQSFSSNAFETIRAVERIVGGLKIIGARYGVEESDIDSILKGL